MTHPLQRYLPSATAREMRVFDLIARLNELAHRNRREGKGRGWPTYEWRNTAKRKWKASE